MVEAPRAYLQGAKFAGILTYPEKMPPQIELKGNEPAGTALREILFNCLQGVIKSQQEFLDQPDEPEKLHQFRVKLRKLRAMFSFSRPFINQSKYIEFQEKLRQLGMELAYLRELDVLAAEWAKIQNSQEDYQKLAVLAGVLREKRSVAISQVREKLLCGRATRPLLEFWALLLDNYWEEILRPAVSIADFAEGRLKSWFKKFSKEWEVIDVTDHAAIHRLRIKGKKLRYAIENVKLFFKENTHAVANTLETIQKQLGNLHDNYRNLMLVHELLAESAIPELHYEAGILIGWQASQTNDLRDKLKNYHFKLPF